MNGCLGLCAGKGMLGFVAAPGVNTARRAGVGKLDFCIGERVLGFVCLWGNAWIVGGTWC